MADTVKAMHSIRIGPAGWSYKDWEQVVYPPHGSKFDALAYLASFFDTIEVNSPFYRIPPPTHAKSWVRRVSSNAQFRFTTKVFRGFTHEATPPTATDTDAFRHYLDPLMESGHLGAVLLQFPWSFRHTPEALDKLQTLFGDFAQYPKALEVRHSSFQNEEFFRFLDENDVSWVNIDQPQFHDSVSPSQVVTGPVGYARIHGRNYEKWFAHGESWERYDYLYTREELEPWASRITTMAQQRDTYVITNNHFRGQAIVNAGDLKQAIGQDPRLPPQLQEVYGERLARG
ncbi:MAG TPA: DUF72 domain-containing protein [Thermoanaerobaculia bacterium]